MAEAAGRKGFFWGAGLGGGYVERTCSTTNGFDDATARFYMEFFGGYAFNPHVAVGMEIGGWLIEPDSDTYIWNPYWPPDNESSAEPTGEGLSQILVFTRVYPCREQGLFIKLGGGYMNHWLKTSSGRYNEDGWTTVAGLGWDIHVSGKWSVTPTLCYSYGIAGTQTHQAVTAAFGFMWHQWEGPKPQLPTAYNATPKYGRGDTTNHAGRYDFLRTAYHANSVRNPHLPRSSP